MNDTTWATGPDTGREKFNEFLEREFTSRGTATASPPLSGASSPLGSYPLPRVYGLLFYLFGQQQLLDEDTLYINFGYQRANGPVPSASRTFPTPTIVWSRCGFTARGDPRASGHRATVVELSLGAFRDFGAAANEAWNLEFSKTFNSEYRKKKLETEREYLLETTLVSRPVQRERRSNVRESVHE